MSFEKWDGALPNRENAYVPPPEMKTISAVEYARTLAKTFARGFLCALVLTPTIIFGSMYLNNAAHNRPCREEVHVVRVGGYASCAAGAHAQVGSDGTGGQVVHCVCEKGQADVVQHR